MRELVICHLRIRKIFFLGFECPISVNVCKAKNIILVQLYLAPFELLIDVFNVVFMYVMSPHRGAKVGPADLQGLTSPANIGKMDTWEKYELYISKKYTG